MRARTIVIALLSSALPFTGAGGQTLPGTLPAAPQQPASPAQPPVVLHPPPGVAPIAPTPPPGTPAPAAATQRFRGTLQEFDGPFLTLRTTDRKTVTLGMTTATRILHNRLLQFTDLQPGWYIGVAALKSADGKVLRAQAVRVYPANTRGTGEGAYPLDPKTPERLLVNGSITAVAPGGIGGTLTVGFHGSQPAGSAVCDGKATPDACTGAANIVYARGVPIVAIEAGDVSQLLPSATISVAAAPDAGGTMVATSVTIERDPPAKPNKPE